jgi:hypothetical protein
MTFRIVYRKFTALQFPKGSPERNRLNKSSLTSEHARFNKVLVTKFHRPIKTFRTEKEAIEFINDPDKEKYKPKNKIKKYTVDNYLNSKKYFEKKKNNIKEGFKYD